MNKNYHFVYESDKVKVHYKYESPILHRLDGPAIKYKNGMNHEWFIDGIKINCSSQEEFDKIIRMKAFW